MLINFKQYVKRESLLDTEDKILCTVSGGVDSMSLCMLLIEAGYSVAIAHCNFSLRCEESDGDELHVQKFAKKYNLTLHTIHFNTKEFAKNNGLSTQMAARTLRYDWFSELAEKFGYTKIAVAHNADDTIETFFINLIRSAGVNGLTGVANRNGIVVRPLIFASRADILKYAEQKGLTYRTDSSNLSTHYLRNWIRLELLPQISERSDNFSSTMVRNMRHIASHNALFNRLMKDVKKTVLTVNDSGLVEVNLLKIKEYEEQSHELLYEIIKEYGFTSRNVKSILKVEGSGRLFLAQNHRALVDRDRLIIEKYSVESSENFGELKIEEICDKEAIEQIENLDFRQIPKNIAYISGEKIEKADLIKLRKWQEGDKFTPIGMKGTKKISDFLTDLKLSIYQKERQMVVECENEIVWVVTLRVSERFKIKKGENRVFKLEFLEVP
ncbi:MAG: tRNA lysidine(34) synthetase TilS [Rikenellaceae bacterium]